VPAIMPLKYKCKTKDEIPAEHLPLYAEREGAWVLDVDGAVEKSKLDERRRRGAGPRGRGRAVPVSPPPPATACRRCRRPQHITALDRDEQGRVPRRAATAGASIVATDRAFMPSVRTERSRSQRGRGPSPVRIEHDTRQRASNESIIGPVSTGFRQRNGTERKRRASGAVRWRLRSGVK
jgi:hypothetical protein